MYHYDLELVRARRQKNVSARKRSKPHTRTNDIRHLLKPKPQKNSMRDYF